MLGPPRTGPASGGGVRKKVGVLFGGVESIQGGPRQKFALDNEKNKGAAGIIIIRSAGAPTPGTPAHLSGTRTTPY